MPKKKLNLTGKGRIANATDNSKMYQGTTQDLLKNRQKRVGEFLEEIEKAFESYSGGGVSIVMNEYDENNKPTGAKVLILGADDIFGLVNLAKSTHHASENIIETTIENVSKSGNPGAIMELINGLMGETEEED